MIAVEGPGPVAAAIGRAAGAAGSRAYASVWITAAARKIANSPRGGGTAAAAGPRRAAPRERGAPHERESHECPDARGGKPEIRQVQRQEDPEVAVSERPGGLCREDGGDLAIGMEPGHVVACLKVGATCWGLTTTQRVLSI